MKKHLKLTAIVFIFVFVFSLALLSSPKQRTLFVAKTDDLISSLNTDDISLEQNCEIKKNGELEISNGDAYILFEDLNVSFQTVVLKFTRKSDSPFVATLYYDTGYGYNEEQKALTSCFEGDESITFSIPDCKYTGLRIDIDNDYYFDSVELHSKPAEQVSVKFPISIRTYFISFLFSFVFSCIFYFIEKKRNWSNKILVFLSNNRKSLFIGLVSFAVTGVLCVIIELIIGYLIVGPNSNGDIFNLRRFIFIFGANFSAVFLFLCRKIAAKKFEYILLGIVLITGSVMILVMPFGHASWDVESHYKWAFFSSHIGNTYITEADILVMTNDPHSFPGENAKKNISNISYMNNAYKNIIGQQKSDFSLPHSLSGLFIAIGSFFGGSFYQVFTLAKFANLFIYAFCCYFAARKLKSGKMILSVIALFPTSIFLASSYSYDFWVTGFIFVGMAYYISERQQFHKQISTKDTMIMCGSFALACLPKLIYAPLLIIPFFMNREKIDNKKKYYGLCTITIIILFFLLLMRAFLEAKNGGDIRGGSDVSTVGQIKYILSNPFEYAKTLIKFLSEYLSFSNMQHYISNFAYIGMGSGSAVFIILMIVTAVTDKNQCDTYASNWYLRIISLLLYFGISALIATSLYIAFTSVGNTTILGCQPRYIIPLLYPLLSIIGYGKFNNKMNRTVYNYLILIPCCAVLFYNIYNTMITKWM